MMKWKHETGRSTLRGEKLEALVERDVEDDQWVWTVYPIGNPANAIANGCSTRKKRVLGAASAIMEIEGERV